MTKQRYEIGTGAEDEVGLILIVDHERGTVVARSSQSALKDVEELVRLANRPADEPSDDLPPGFLQAVYDLPSIAKTPEWAKGHEPRADSESRVTASWGERPPRGVFVTVSSCVCGYTPVEGELFEFRYAMVEIDGVRFIDCSHGKRTAVAPPLKPAARIEHAQGCPAWYYPPGEGVRCDCGAEKSSALLCPKCGVDRSKEPCDYTSPIASGCPMIGSAQRT